jgi:hypothetical protein
MANNGNRGPRPNNQQRPATTPTPAPEQPPEETGGEDKIVTANTDVQAQDGVASNQVAEGQSNTDASDAEADALAESLAAQVGATIEEPVTEETAVTDETVDDEPVSASDDPLVAQLQETLAAFKAENSTGGDKPEHFRSSAKIANEITRFVIKHPTTAVLTALLDFFAENKDGVAKGENFMKGSTTLAHVDEQKVGFINGLFSGLANGQAGRIESATIVRVLGKQEFVTFYNRRAAALRQSN